MIRALRLVDIPRQLLSGRLASRDLVYTRGTLGSPNPRLTNLNAARYGMPRARGYKAIGAFEDQRLEALAVLRSRSGPSAWEVARLFASASGYAQLDSLLSAAGAAAASSGAERLLLRSPMEGPAMAPALRAGFQRAFAEELFVGSLVRTHETAMSLRPFNARDTQELFRLHLITAPPTARLAIGMTIGQWSASREESAGATQEFVCDSDRGIGAWVRIDSKGREITLEALLHPDLAPLSQTLIESAARVVGSTTQARWIVPTHQPQMARALTQRNWSAHGSYEIASKPIAIRVHQPAMTPAQA